jgi:hypothetical protein
MDSKFSSTFSNSFNDFLHYVSMSSTTEMTLVHGNDVSSQAGNARFSIRKTVHVYMERQLSCCYIAIEA